MSAADLVDIVIYDAPTTHRGGGCGCGCDHHHHQPGRRHAGQAPGLDHCHGDEPCPEQGPCQGHGDPLSTASIEMQTQALAMTMWKAFPGKVRVEYINVLQDPQTASLPQAKLLLSLAYPTPLVYINGQGRFAGAIPVERLRDEVEKILASRTA